MVSPSAIRHKTGGKRICCRFGSINAHVEQERPELSRIGNRKSLKKSDDGCQVDVAAVLGKEAHRIRVVSVQSLRPPPGWPSAVPVLAVLFFPHVVSPRGFILVVLTRQPCAAWSLLTVLKPSSVRQRDGQQESQQVS